MFLTDNISWLAQHEWTVTAVWRPHCSWSTETEEDAGPTAMRIKLDDAAIQPSGVSLNGDEGHPASTVNAPPGRRARHRAGMRLHHSLILLERFAVLGLDVNVEQIGPGYVELTIDTSFGPMCILQTVTPVGPLLQRVIHQIFSPPVLAPYASLVFLGECLMFERDVAIWNHKRYERQPTLVREDRTILAYRRWYAQFYTANSPSYQTAAKDLEW